MTEALSEQEKSLLDLSVDEIFSKHSVHTVQSLHRDYKASVTKAKDELHSLVGHKYRDLIRIAEDIDSMTSMSSSIDGQLASLSYRPPKSVVFGKNSYAKFDSMTRRRHAASARQLSQKTILNNILNDQLITFDLKLRTNALKGTSRLVHMAKVYRTVSTVFGATLASDAHYSQHFNTLKSSFMAYLESKIASVSANDPSGEILKQTLFHNSKAQVLEPDNIDFLSEFEEEDEAEAYSDTESSGVKKTFGGVISPIISYLAAYILVSHETISQEFPQVIASKVLQLRHQHLQAVVQSSSSPTNNVNFPTMIKFVESTYEYVQKYLLDNSHSEVFKQLSSLSSWRASEVLGFNDWLTEDPIIFEVPQFASTHMSIADLPDTEVNSFTDLIHDLFLQALNAESDKLSAAEQLMSMFYNFISSLRKSEILALTNDCVAYTINVLVKQNFATSLSDFVLHSISTMIEKHHIELTGIIPTAVNAEFLAILEKQKYPYELCTQEFVDIIDNNVEQYFDRLVEVTTIDDSKSAEQDTVSRFKSWFSQEQKLLGQLSTTDSDLLCRITEALQRKYGEEDVFDKWGTFSSVQFQAKCDDSRDQILSKLREKLVAVIDQMSEHVDGDYNSLSKTHFLLKSFLVLKNNIASMLGPSGVDTKIDDRISSLFSQVFDHLSKNISEEGRLSMISSPETLSPGYESATTPTRPHLLVYSALEQLACECFNSEIFTHDEMFDLVSNKECKGLYVQAKNTWVMEHLIKGSIIRRAAGHLHESASAPGIATQVAEKDDDQVDDDDDNAVSENEESVIRDADAEVGESAVSSEKAEQQTEVEMNGASKALAECRQLLANAVFAFNLTSNEGVSSSDERLIDTVKSLNSMFGTEPEDLAVEIIVRGVNEFYKSSREIYFPLSMN